MKNIEAVKIIETVKGYNFSDKAMQAEFNTRLGYIDTDKQPRFYAQKYQDLLDIYKTFESAKPLDYVKISVEWKKSRTWGSNPHVEVWTTSGYYTGTASGCGYDKESSAVAQALNQCPSCRQFCFNDKLKDLYGISRGQFNGGVGMNCFIRAFEDMGFKREGASGKAYDAYWFDKREEALR